MHHKKELSLRKFLDRFSTEESCEEFLYQQKWPDGFICPKCGCREFYHIKGRKLYQCKHCRHQSSVTANTVMLRTHKPLMTWFQAIYFVASDKRGISAFDIKGEAHAEKRLPENEKDVLDYLLYLSLAALEMLKHLRSQEPEGYDGYIANADGKPLNDANFRRRFNSLLSQANVEHCGRHAMRHTFAYYYVYTNGNRKLVADYLGHSISNLTERVYVTTSDRFMEQSIRDFVI